MAAGNNGPNSTDALERAWIRQDEKPGQLGEPYGATDPRNARAIGGVKLGDKFLFLEASELPCLEVPRIIQACQDIVSGQGSYAGLLYLSRTRVDDTEALFSATESPDVRQRWERLWVLSPYFSRVSRHPEGSEKLVARMRDDLASVHLLSKFVDQKNDAVVRLFKRLHDPLLEVLLENLRDNHRDPRRCQLLVEIIAVVERDRDVLRTALVATGNVADPDALIALLVTRAGKGGRLSADVLRRRLQDLGND